MKGYLGAKIEQEWLRTYPMDVSDVYYNAFLLNGMKDQTLPHLKAGDKVRLRIINASSSTYFWLQFAGGKMTVVANDGNPVVPVKVDRLIIEEILKPKPVSGGCSDTCNSFLDYFDSISRCSSRVTGCLVVYLDASIFFREFRRSQHFSAK